jgi:hypothetical protein
MHFGPIPDFEGDQEGRRAGAGEMAPSGSDGSERLALSGAQSSCRADRFFVAAGAFILILDGILCNYFFGFSYTRQRRERSAETRKWKPRSREMARRVRTEPLHA